MSNNNETNSKEKRINEIIEERTHLVTELFSKPKKKRLQELQQKISALDEEYILLHE